MTHASRSGRAIGLIALLALVATVVMAPMAGAQGGPPWDHYKVYNVTPNPFDGRTVGLRDQFGSWNVGVTYLERFANPTEKHHAGAVSPIFNPRLHYTWWAISQHPFNATIEATNQFGDQVIDVTDPRYLLNPALKNESGPPPDDNHYKCYDCTGANVDQTVVMVDQWGTWQAEIRFPRYFCTPVEKTHADGTTFPIRDPDQHYICYIFDPPDPRVNSAAVSDQFIPNIGLQIENGHLLCVPTMKVDPTPTLPETWGRLKVLYR